ncbi:hypothetical protein CYY_008067 [Polysphondylium violaceum]|uniref:C2H2-type domain-containing protein n=1 Tax=Polysphondylium violaceum TaxID=133409 RepID=A0A8J4PPF4_9MYCE|nr:hypothetical protein CYY_008067 [Polysphondylium violaceum]
MGRYRGYGGTHTKNKQYKRARSTKNRAKDIDQIYNEIQPENIEKYTKIEIDPELPGMGQHFCIHCSKHYITDEALNTHFQTKTHKRRVKELKVKPYMGEHSYLPIDNGKKLRPTPADSTDTTTTTTTMDS